VIAITANKLLSGLAGEHGGQGGGGVRGPQSTDSELREPGHRRTRSLMEGWRDQLLSTKSSPRPLLPSESHGDLRLKSGLHHSSSTSSLRGVGGGGGGRGRGAAVHRRLHLFLLLLLAALLVLHVVWFFATLPPVADLADLEDLDGDEDSPQSWDGSETGSGPKLIPRILHQAHASRHVLSVRQRELMQSWARQHGSWDIRFYGDQVGG
jgi:hypothetical protein